MADETSPATTPTAPTEAIPASPATPTSPAEATAPIDLAPEVKEMEQHYTKQPDKFILTVKVKRFFFGVKGATITILQDDKQVDTAQTDKHGEIAFTLLPGDYTVTYGEKKTQISIKQHSTLKL